MRLYAPREFVSWLNSQPKDSPSRRYGDAALRFLRSLPAIPADDLPPTLKRVRQARRHPIWRISHPYDPEVAVRVLCWFPEADAAVVALVGGDKASIGGRPMAPNPPTPTTRGMTTMTNDTTHEFVNLDDCTDAIDDPAVDAVVSRMWDDIHLHRMGLASVREALGFTQTDLAAELGVTQSNVAQTERRKDILVSTLARYLGAIRADLHLVVRFEGRPPVELSLDELTEA